MKQNRMGFDIDRMLGKIMGGAKGKSPFSDTVSFNYRAMDPKYEKPVADKYRRDFRPFKGWTAFTQIPKYDAPLLRPEEEHYNMRLEKMSPDEFLDKQATIGYSHPTLGQRAEKGESYEHYKQSFLADASKRGKERIRKGFESGRRVIPTPIIELDEHGQLKGWQEGRHRGLVAKEMGFKEMPVWIATPRKEEVTKPEPDEISQNLVICKTSNASIFPDKTSVQRTYAKLPNSDKKVPIVFETRRQYNEEYLRNQEKQRGIKFTQDEKNEYLRTEGERLKPVSARFTTYHNKYMEPRLVIFPGKRASADLNGDGRIDKKDDSIAVRNDISHEVGHELEERNPSLMKEWVKKIRPSTSPTIYGTTNKAEDLAESFALLQNPKSKAVNNPRTSPVEIQKRFGILRKHIKK